jgi:very-short-patch-repair endonuclease
VKNGTWTSWRKNTEPSYPEKFFMKVLENNSISYEYEFPFGRYSIDFALLNKKIAFEVDGQQHRFPDRQVSDKKKDELLVSSGWKVFRTKWKGNRYQKRREYIKSEIDRFLAFYNSTPDVLPI